MEEQVYIRHFNRSIIRLFQNALRISWRYPRDVLFLFRTLAWQRKAVRIRSLYQSQNIPVPAFMIASITHKCNLQCRGCYAQAFQKLRQNKEMSPEILASVIRQASELGVSIILVAGGEPLTRPEILDIMQAHPEIIFPLFTNGTLLDDALVERLSHMKNVVPILSIEGYEPETDDRRGQGVYERILNIMKRLREKRVFFGVSLTMTRTNFSLITDRTFIHNLIREGARLSIFVEYVPVKPGTENLVLTEEQKQGVTSLTDGLKRQFPGLFIAFPGDEDKFGGCLSSGRGFVHVSPEGNLEPCPFAPYSDVNLNDVSLKDALQSRFLTAIRKNHNQLTETVGGCALWEKREWVASLLKSGE